jgi:hypothetical protein
MRIHLLGDHTTPGRAKPIFYYGWNDSRDELEAVLKARGYQDFILLDIQAIQWVALDILSSIQRHIEKTPGFEGRLLKNAGHFLFDLQAFKLEDELGTLHRLAELKRSEGGQDDD